MIVAKRAIHVGRLTPRPVATRLAFTIDVPWSFAASCRHVKQSAKKRIARRPFTPGLLCAHQRPGFARVTMFHRRHLVQPTMTAVRAARSMHSMMRNRMHMRMTMAAASPLENRMGDCARMRRS